MDLPIRAGTSASNTPPPHRWAVVLVLCASVLIVNVDTTILGSTAPDQSNVIAQLPPDAVPKIGLTK
jgi:hypothetical protein